MPEVELTMKAVRPFWATQGRATVIASDATEEQRSSGLFVPMVYEGDDGIKRGVVIDVTEPVALDRGTVIFYYHGIKVGDVVVVDLVNVIAYESEET